MSATITIYGIKSCDTMRKAMKWLEAHSVAYSFHDYKKQGIDTATLKQWAQNVGWEKLLNKAGTTFRKLPDSEKENIDESRALALMVAYPSLIKRPVLDREGEITVGFKPEVYADLFAVN
ncbi:MULTISPECIES: ArsC family reductase [Acetobacter]|uniref:ArsC family reductase n=2 Tax=Acetobacter TaxID=434 RepID=A0AAN1PFW0_9PROT|nr:MULTISPECIES: ArsC family reductase [Acetobacter]ASL41207.1 ArsC family reductase [Acetobacter oryzifermentans]AXM99470.1 ArsC family reductase [Acetobacter pomorum]KAA8394615.1 ArsC family reductase [Acetobacter sp. DmW_125127]KAA8398131.1 ArsC family reductase [Acetobacter sp. DmW_125124]KAA8400266.1 ArsC family reductase [Acetobacter sp. DmW_125128]